MKRTSVTVSASERPALAESEPRRAAIGEVAAGIARELRQPLLAISSAAQLLRFRVADDPVVEKNVGRILREVERLNGFSAALLDYASPGSPHLVPADPDTLWDDVLESERGRLESRAILLQRVRAAPSTRCAVDVAQIKQLLSELLENACDAAPEGSDLALDSAVLADGSWRCRLHNGGNPIPPAALPRVFDLFFSSKPGSAGLGLALCRRIVEDHGGAIAIDSAESGTTITLTLPANPGSVSDLTPTRTHDSL
jgi:signal transduction histidine kinase